MADNQQNDRGFGSNQPSQQGNQNQGNPSGQQGQRENLQGAQNSGQNNPSGEKNRDEVTGENRNNPSGQNQNNPAGTPGRGKDQEQSGDPKEVPGRENERETQTPKAGTQNNPTNQGQSNQHPGSGGASSLQNNEPAE